MTVRKYRHVSEMDDGSWRTPGDPGLIAAIRATWELARGTTPLHFPPGVYKHPSIDAAEALRETWDKANFEAFHERRRDSR